MLTHKEFSQRGGRASVKKRLGDKTPQEVSEIMRKVRNRQKLGEDQDQVESNTETNVEFSPQV